MVKSANVEFDEFVKRQTASAAAARNLPSEPVDWNKQREEWLAYLAGLYDEIKSFLKAYTDNGSIKLKRDKISITENDIGTYDADKMTIYIGTRKITLTPIGTMLIGTKGRVDVAGSAGKSRLVLINKAAKSSHDLIKITVTVIDPKRPTLPPTPKSVKREPIEWAWKIVNSPPATTFMDLNAASFMQMLLEVSNG